jgi:hypothetical protein
MVSSEIQAKMRPAIRQCIELACANLWGYVPSFRFTFPPLKTVPALDQEQIRQSMTTRMLALVSAGLVSGKKVGDELAAADAISAELAAAFVDNPLPSQQGVEGTPETAGIEVYRAEKEAKKNDSLLGWLGRKDK